MESNSSKVAVQWAVSDARSDDDCVTSTVAVIPVEVKSTFNDAAAAEHALKQTP